MKKYFYSKLFALLLVTTAAVSSCGKDNTDNPTPPAQTIDEQLNHWMFDYMKERYLWNEAVKTLKPDFSVNYNHFLQNVLNGVAAQGDVNHDDGHWRYGERFSFYSNIGRYQKTKAQQATRGTRETASGTGISFMRILPIYDEKDNPIEWYFELLSIAPGSVADKAGLERGTLITRVNGKMITLQNYEEMAEVLTPTDAGVSVRVTLAELDQAQDKLTPTREITLVSASYDDNPVWLKKIFEADKGDKVGYLCYASFNLYYDRELMEVFKEFKAAGVKELILDLRYNGGGHIISSTVLGTMIAGEAKKGLIYSNTSYNKSRTDAGEKGDQYRIGDGEYWNHKPLTEALGSDYALDLNQVYVLCTSSTASASELVVNGLRGLDIDVRLIGETTNGKNVGMEPKTKTLGDYDYVFSPITFYSTNAKGFKNYSSGFQPDVKVEEAGYFTCPWGDPEDPLLHTAMQWINDGVKPSEASPSPSEPTSLGVRSAAWQGWKASKIIKCGDGLEGMILSQPADQLR